MTPSDLATPKALFQLVRACSTNSQLYALCEQISKISSTPTESETPSEILNALDSLTIASTDEELKACLRILLVYKVRTNELPASELAQYEKLFNLGASKTDVDIRVIDFTRLCTDCPRCSAPDPARIDDPSFLTSELQTESNLDQVDPS